MRLNPALEAFACSACEHRLPAEDVDGPVGLCARCGMPLQARYALSAASLQPQDGRRGLLRWEAALPVLEFPPGYVDDVGDTPVAPLPALGRSLDLDLWVKREGGNPSGSFKDRGLAVGVALGSLLGARRFCLPTQGNAGVAACLFSARLALPPCVVYMPEAWRGSVYHRSCRLFGGEVRFAGANVAEAGRAMRAELGKRLAAGALVDLSTFFEPGRLEGKKTMGLEIASAFADAPPEWIVYPTGGGTGLIGILKAYEELAAAGVIRGAPPRLVAVQSARCAPVVDAFRTGLDRVAPVVSQGTVADGLDVPSTIMGHRILAAIRATGGTAVAVGDEAILAAFGASGAAGMPTSLEGAATLAAVGALRGDGSIPAGSRVLLLYTAGHLVHVGRVGVGVPAR
jgi:threonine synthase